MARSGASAETTARATWRGRIWIAALAICALLTVVYAASRWSAGAFPAAAGAGTADGGQAARNSTPVSHSTKLLLFSHINPVYAAAHAADWRSKGFSGFMFDGGLPAFDYPRDAYQALDAATMQAAVSKLIAAGVTDNFLKVSSAWWNTCPGFIDPATGRAGIGYGDIFDDAAWGQVVGGLKSSARFAKQTGMVGLVIDVEAYGGAGCSFLRTRSDAGHTSQDTRAKAQQRGQQVAGALLTEYPGLVLLLIPEIYGSIAWKDGAYTCYPDFCRGLASQTGVANLLVGTEGSYKEANLARLRQRLDRETAMPALLPGWPAATNIALGAFPLGKAKNDKSAWYSAAVFSRQLQNFRAALPQARYVWIYDWAGAWWYNPRREAYFPPADVAWPYRDWPANLDSDFVDMNLPDFFAATESVFGP